MLFTIVTALDHLCVYPSRSFRRSVKSDTGTTGIVDPPSEKKVPGKPRHERFPKTSKSNPLFKRQ